MATCHVGGIMKKLIALILLIPLLALAQTRVDGLISNGAVSIGNKTAADSKSILDAHSTTKGLLIPRMTTTQRDAISSPTTSLMIFNSTLGFYQYYNSTWLSLVCETCTQTLTNKTMSGSSNTFTNIPLGSSVTGILPVLNGGTGMGTLTLNGVVFGNGTSAAGVTSAGSQYQVFQAGGSGVPTVDAVHLDQAAAVTGTLPIIKGGTGSTTLTTNGVLYGGPTSISAIPAGSQYQVYQAGGSGVPTIGAVDLSQSAAITNNLPITNGGTNASNKWAAFNNLSPLSTKGDLVVYSSTNDRIGVGSDGQVLTADSTQTYGVKWATVTPASANLSVVSKTANYTLTASDDAVLGDASGGGFTLTLPTAVGNSGKIFYIKRTDNTLANQITIATTSSQTIDGLTTRKLYTLNEEWQVVSDNANWRVLNHKTLTFPVTYSLTIGATTTAPTKGTMTVDSAVWHRIGSRVCISYHYYQSAATGAANGSGTYLLPTPSGITYDTTLQTASTVTTVARPGYGIMLGDGTGHSLADSSAGSMFVQLYNSTNVVVNFNFGTGQYWGTNTATSSYSLNSGNEIVLSLKWCGIVSGWDE